MKKIAKIQPTLYSWAGENLSTDNTHTVGMTAVTDETTGSVSYTANRMYLHFDMPVLPNNCQTQKAELILTQINSTDEATVTPKLALFPVTAQIAANTAAPTADTALVDYELIKTGENTSYAFDISKLVHGDATSCGMVLQFLDENIAASSSATFYGIGSAEYAPSICITYDVSYGVNTGNRTHTHSIGFFGQGSIDIHRGCLMLEAEDFAWGGNRMPVTLKHLYHSALAQHSYTGNSDMELNTADYSAMAIGKGWKLNIMQSMVSATFLQEGETVEGYVFVGENGEETYFKVSNQQGTAEDGSAYALYEAVEDEEMLYDPQKQTLTWGDETNLFDATGRLIRVTDSHGNQMNMVYDEGRLVCITDGIDRSFSLTYGADNSLSSVTAPDGSCICYSYDENGLLDSVIYPDGRKAVISYTDSLPTEIILYDAAEMPEYKVKYQFTGNRLTGVQEYGATDGTLTAGAAASYTYTPVQRKTTTVFTVPEDSEDSAFNVITTVYSFDEEGNVIGEYAYSDKMGNTGVDGSGTSGVHPYAGEGRIPATECSQNLLLNGDFKKLHSYWNTMPDNGAVFSYDFITDETSSVYGTKYLQLCSSDENCTANGIYQDNYAAEGENTFSAYVHVKSDFTGENVPGVYLRVVDEDGIVLAESEHLAKADSEYIRLAVPFTVPETVGTILGQKVRVQLLVNGQGTADIDAVQLEGNASTSNYNLLEDGLFDIAGSWTGINNSRNAQEHFSLPFSMSVTGDLNAKRQASQGVSVKQAASTRETFTLSGWAKGSSVPIRDREGVETPIFCLRAIVNYAATEDEPAETESYTADFSPYAGDWQQASVQFAKKKYKNVRNIFVCCEYDYNYGTVYFDNICLSRDSIETDLTAEDFLEETEASAPATKHETPGFTELTDAFGNTLTETTFANGEFGTLYRCFDFGDDGNNLLSETDTRGGVTSYDVDENTSRNKTITDRCGNKTCYEYDEAGRTTKVISKNAQDAEQANVSYNYDAFDNLLEIVRGDGLKYAMAYNEFHNLESIGVDGSSKKLVSYTYKTGTGRLKAVTYANGDKMNLSYNSLGQMVSEKWYNAANALTAHYQYSYDAQGNIIRSVDILGCKEYSYIYEDGQLIRSGECAITISSDGFVTARTPICVVRYHYDTDGTLFKKRILPANGEERIIFYETDENDSPVVKFTADGMLITSHSKTDSFGRKVFDELQLGTGFVSRQFTYHAGDVTDAHSESGKVKSSATTQLVSQIVLSDGRTLSYSYDAEERIVAVVESDGEETTATEYTYDALGQLLTETVDGVVVNEMTYDNYGNILTKNGKVYTYGDSVWKDKLTAYNGQEISCDAQGNPVVYLGHTLTWEKGRQLKTFDSNTYTYNTNGIRTSKTVNGVIHTYTLNGANILQEEWDGNTLIPLRDNEEAVCGILYNGTPFYFLKNLQGDIIAITDESGDTVTKYTYDAWGKCTVISDISSCNIATVNPYRYRGYYYDEEIAMYYLQSRYYDPEIYRFLNSDKSKFIGFGQTLSGYNLFTYCENNPENNTDRFGFGPWTNWLTLSDYRTIHNKVADLVRWSLGLLKAQREVYVKGPKGRGYLDVYDISKREYYEVKSSGAAYKASTKKQMEKYDVAKPLFCNRSIQRGTKKVKGSFYYGAWKVSYKLKEKGLVVYTTELNRTRLKTVTTTVILVAITLISISAFATGGATTPAYAILLI